MTGAARRLPGRVRVVIVNYGSWELAAECAASLGAQTYRDFRLVVVDNASPDDSAARLRERLPGAVLLEAPRNLGWGGGLNLGFRHPDPEGAPEFYLTLNSDARLDPDCLARLVAALRARPDCAVVAPALRGGKGIRVGYDLSYRYFLPLDLARWSGARGRYARQGIRSVTWVDDPAALMRAGAVDAAGGYDEGYFMYLEMTDLAYRLRALGWSLAVEYRAGAFHAGKGSSRRDPAFAPFHKLRNWLRFQRKHFPASHLPYVWAWLALAYGAISARLVLGGQARAWARLTRGLLRGRLPEAGTG